MHLYNFLKRPKLESLHTIKLLFSSPPVYIFDPFAGYNSMLVQRPRIVSTLRHTMAAAVLQLVVFIS